MHVSDRLDDMPILDNMQAKTTKVIIETWENICDSVQAMIIEGQSACEHSWSSSKVLLGYFDLHVLDPIAKVLSPKLQQEQVERHFNSAKEQIQQINQLTM